MSISPEHESPDASAALTTTSADAGRRFRRRSQTSAEVVGHLEGQPRGRLLDLPCGTGRVTARFVELGYDVVPADLFPEYFQLDDPPVVQANMTDKLPFPDRSFDYVVSQEGVEHIEAPLAFARECARVLRPGGQLILTTPNVLHLSARLAYLLVGHRTTNRGLIHELLSVHNRVGSEVHHGHAWHWRYHLLRYVLRLAGFRVDKPLRGKYSAASVLMTPLLYPALWLAHRRAIGAHVRKSARRVPPDVLGRATEAYDEILEHSLSRGVLWNKKLILVAHREARGLLEDETP